MHVEKYGNIEVEGIELGKSYVFPKIDGTNGSVWSGDKSIKAASRNRELELSKDNAGFYNWVLTQEKFDAFFKFYPSLRLYGEWLVPHSLKTYRDDAWKKFYVFDVCNDLTGQYVPYEQYQKILEQFEIDYLAPIIIINNADVSCYTKALDKNVFLIKDGEGIGEGVVIKNYDYYNKFGNQIWAKIVTSEFKERHTKVMGAPEIGHISTEFRIVEQYVTKHLVDKVVAKIENEGEWSSRCIPRLLQTVFYDLVNEEMWNIIKEYKNPTIQFKALANYSTGKIKELRSDLF